MRRMDLSVQSLRPLLDAHANVEEAAGDIHSSLSSGRPASSSDR